MKSLDDFFERVKATCAESFNRRGEHVPTFLLDARDGLVVMPAPWRDQTEKQVAVLAVKELAKQVQATRVCVITEGWMVERSAGADTEGLVTSREPDRIEVVWILAQSSVPGERERAGHYAVVRDAAGKASVGEWRSHEEGRSLSIFSGIVGAGILQ